ncbi:hypothetical protein [Clostridium hydrogenum]|nr:hypothetical protein [Clostridium hydrogenum]
MNTSKNQVQELPTELLEQMNAEELSTSCKCARNRPGAGPFQKNH